MNLEGYTIGDFDRGAPRWKEALWVFAKALFFQHSLPCPSVCRVAILRAFGATVGRGVVIRSRVNISYPWRLLVGDHVWMGEEVMILSLAPVTLGPSVCLSQRAFLCTGSHAFHRSDFALRTKPITIHAGSWIAAQAFIAPGVSVGPNSMVCAGSVALVDVAEGTTVRGNPAVLVEPRPVTESDPDAGSSRPARVATTPATWR